MNEETTRKVAMKYFESKGLKPIPQRGGGPDFLIDGMAVEVKGSECARRSETKRMLKQVIDYTYKNPHVSLFLPIDGLTLESSIQLETLGHLIAKAGRNCFDLYIVVESTFDKRTFLVAKASRIYNIPPTINTIFDPKHSFEIAEKEPYSVFLRKVEPLINWKPREHLKRQFEKARIYEERAFIPTVAFGEGWKVVKI